MLMNMKELLKVADEKRFAVPAFNIGSDQLLKAVMQKVKEMKSPVILEMSPDEFNFVENSLIQAMIYEASKQMYQSLSIWIMETNLKQL